MNKELWLAVYYLNDEGQTDLSWYNEGNANEFGTFLKHIWKRITRNYKSRMLYEIRYGKQIRFVL